MSILDISNLTKFYGRRRALEALTLDLPEGTVFGFLGPNGAGKTTAIRVLVGLLRPTRGRARIFGLDCWRDGRRIREEIGYLPGDLRLYPSLTTRSALKLFGRVHRRDLTTKGAELSELLGLDPLLRVSQMSRGTRQKLGLVLALAHEPRLAILDEPTTGLDPVIQDKLKQHLLQLARRGHTVFFSSHTLSEVDSLCERVAILREGRVVSDAPLEALRSRASREVHIRWPAGKEAKGEQLPVGLCVVERLDGLWRCEMNGPAGPLLRWLADKDVDDLSIAPPQLERLFRTYYEE